MKVKLTQNASIIGRLRAGNDLKTVLPDRTGDITYTAAMGLVFTIYNREILAASVSQHLTRDRT